MSAHHHSIIAVPSEEPNRLECPKCGGAAFRIFTESEPASVGSLINNIECNACHLMMTLAIANPVSDRFPHADERHKIAQELFSYAGGLATWTCITEDIGDVRPLKDLLWAACAVMSYIATRVEPQPRQPSLAERVLADFAPPSGQPK